ncbi:hypothetical protein HMPREF0972_00752 [Actinomyces sp. oral taxon 848 str. F0332]|nr:hypothetical protein HMPREF0972_00752 [Actinomyces sp. oral taxon 848 str. F0332]
METNGRHKSIFDASNAIAQDAKVSLITNRGLRAGRKTVSGLRLFRPRG